MFVAMRDSAILAVALDLGATDRRRLLGELSPR
jgi:hypothetical protein